RLLGKYPAQAQDPVIAGARRAKKPWVRQELLELAAETAGDRLLAFLREELHGPHFRCRVAAARALDELGDPVGVRALIAEWRRFDRGDFDRSGDASLLRGLARPGQTAALRALTADFDQLAPTLRHTILEELASLKRDARGWPLSAEVERFVEARLAAAL